MAETLSLLALGVETDPGTEWHPDKPEAYTEDGLRDLSDEEVAAHVLKPEVLEQHDAACGEFLAAEDSRETPEGEI